MAIQEFTFADMAKIDGHKIAIAVDRMLKHLAEDCEDRPTVKTARKAVITIEMKPIHEDGFLKDVSIDFHLAEKIPKKQSAPYVMGVRKSKKGPIIVYNPDALDNADQETFDFGNE